MLRVVAIKYSPQVLCGALGDFLPFRLLIREKGLCLRNDE